MHSYSALPGAFFFTLVLLLTIAFVTLVSKWKVYAKLGMPGWYSLVPIISLLTIAQLATIIIFLSNLVQIFV